MTDIPQQVAQVAGAILILTAFLLAQTKRLATDSVVYLVLNLVGSVVLAVLAWLDRDLGFLLLEAVWAVVSAVGLLAVLKRPRQLA